MSLAISLAQWSLHRAIFSGRLDPLDFPRVARRDFGISAVELVSQLLPSSRGEVVRELKRRAEGEGVSILLVMVDDEGDFCHPARKLRKRAVGRHLKWLDAAADLGCRAVRVNTGAEGSLPWNAALLAGVAPQLRGAIARCSESLSTLAAEAARRGLKVLLENHGGLSANARALVAVVEAVGSPALGLLPDFGNFAAGVDRKAAIADMLPHAGAVSAKTFDFGPDGLETTIDFPAIMDLVLRSGYSGHLGIEYEGQRLGEAEGIRRSKDLLRRWVKEE